MTDSRKSRAAEIQDSIRQVLYNDWHPIPVADLSRDEYDSFIAPVYRILVLSRSEQELIECLFRRHARCSGSAVKDDDRLLRH